MMNERLLYLAQQNEADLLTFGLENLAYLRPVEVEDGNMVGIYAADGTQMAVMASRDEAIATIRQYEMTPMSVH